MLTPEGLRALASLHRRDCDDATLPDYERTIAAGAYAALMSLATMVERGLTDRLMAQSLDADSQGLSSSHILRNGFKPTPARA